MEKEIEKEHAKKCAALKPEAGISECDCDGYHTFDELYEHRIRLFIQLCNSMRILYPQGTGSNYPVWVSTKHSDGSSFGDWFVMGIGKEKGRQVTYHLPARFWNEVCGFAEVLEKAPEWDGHTSDDVLERLKNL